MDSSAASGEIARLEALLGGDPGAPGFAALAEANRRAGRAADAERIAREGLRRRPEQISGRVALALALLDLGHVADARRELEAVLADVPDHPVARGAWGATGDLDDSLDDLEDRELDGALASAEPDLEEMLDANAVAARALRAADLDEPEGFSAPGSPFATRTVADLLEQQGHGAEAAALRRSLGRPDAGTDGDDSIAAEERDRSIDAHERDRSIAIHERDRLIATLERWLDNLRRLRR